MLIDFDDDKDRFRYVESQIPDDLKKRVFILGLQSEPESLKSDVRKTFESIGKALAKDCQGMANELWEHDLLRQNKPELDRILKDVRAFLFILQTGIICTFLMLPLPAGEGWGGGPKVQIVTVGSIINIAGSQTGLCHDS